MFRFKVCCIKNIYEANLAIQHGASTLGLVSHMPSGPGPIPLDLIQKIAYAVRGRVETWMLSSNTTSDAIIKEYQSAQTDGIQLVDDVQEDVCRTLKRLFPDLRLIQVRHVQKTSSAVELAQVNPYIDAILLDSGVPNRDIKILGGTGKTHDWSISKEIISLSQIPVYLAGGLHPDNALEAIQTTNPYGLDICSGLRTKGDLDPIKLRRWSAHLSKV